MDPEEKEKGVSRIRAGEITERAGHCLMWTMQGCWIMLGAIYIFSNASYRACSSDGPRTRCFLLHAVFVFIHRAIGSTVCVIIVVFGAGDIEMSLLLPVVKT